MQLFLLITLQQDPLYLPVSFSARLAGRFPEVTFFHIDHHASPELVNTTVRALDQAARVAIYIQVGDEKVEPNALFPVMRKMVEFDRPKLWLEERNSPFRTFRNLARTKVHTIGDPEEIWHLLEEFYN